MNIIIAGASFPCGVRELGNVALEYGFTPTLIGHPHNAASTDGALTTLRIETGLPDDAVTADRRPSQLLTAAALKNAIRVLHAIAGSTNAIVHLLALAGRLGMGRRRNHSSFSRGCHCCFCKLDVLKMLLRVIKLSSLSFRNNPVSIGLCCQIRFIFGGSDMGMLQSGPGSGQV